MAKAVLIGKAWAQKEISAATNRAMQAYQSAYQGAISREAPFYEAGMGGLNALRGALTPEGGMTPVDMISGLPPGVGADVVNYLTQTPMYEFPFQEGLRAMDRSAASRGMLLSGAQQRGATRYGQNFALMNALSPAMANYQNYLRNIAGLGGVGQTAAGRLGQYDIRTGELFGQANLQQAQLQAGLANAQAGTQMQGQQLNALTSAYNQRNMLGSIGQIGGAVAGLPWGQIGNSLGIGSSYTLPQGIGDAQGGSIYS